MSTSHETLEGVIERITYFNAENGYSVLRVKPKQRGIVGNAKDGLLTVVGNFPELHSGEAVRFTGIWIMHREHGRQFQAINVEQILPTTVEGMRRYLGSGMIKGVGPVTAGRIVDYFGKRTLDVLELEPTRLEEVPGVGQHRAHLIRTGWEAQRHIKEIMLFLQGNGISASLAAKIYKAYGAESISKVRTNPYQLAQDIFGIGFKTADTIARNLGLPPDSPARIAASILFILNEFAENGHTYGARPQVVAEVAELLSLAPELVEVAIERLYGSEQIVIETLPDGQGQPQEALYLPPFYNSERGVARRLLGMVGTSGSRLRKAQTLDFQSVFAYDGNKLSVQQQDAVQAALTHKISVLTGGPGTGKTTTLRAAIHALELLSARYALASPTGRAAKRLSEATARPAQTLHRLLKFKPSEGFLHDEHNPLDVDMLIIDECSMIDLILFYNVLKALTPETHVLLVGDVDQLPSVGAGDVLRDVINSQIAHVTRLDTIFRQQQESRIITNAHRINHGQIPDLDNQGEDFFMFSLEKAEEVSDLLLDIVKNRIPSRFDFDAMEDIQVLAPMRRGSAGIDTLNERLQALLNPNPHNRLAEKQLGGRLFRVGDKVMQTRNNYEKEVFNGDAGRIHSIDMENQTLTVLLDGRLVEYEWPELDELIHAYAISVHRSQGSEYPVVVMPVTTQHYVMLQRNLLYTAVTRAKRLVVLVGMKWAVKKAVGNNTVAQRASGLVWRLTH